MTRGVFSLRELVRRADFENSASWCVVSGLGAIRFPVVWGNTWGFVPKIGAQGPLLILFILLPTFQMLPKSFRKSSKARRLVFDFS